MIDLGDVGSDLSRPRGSLLHVARNLLSCRALLLDCCGDGAGNIGNTVDGAADILDCDDGFLRRSLHARDLGTDLFRRLGGLRSQRLHLLSDDRKALAGFAGTRSLDRRVECKQIGLLGDRTDQIDHVADAAGGLRQFVDAGIGFFGLLHGLAGNLARFLDPPGDLMDGG